MRIFKKYFEKNINFSKNSHHKKILRSNFFFNKILFFYVIKKIFQKSSENFNIFIKKIFSKNAKILIFFLMANFYLNLNKSLLVFFYEKIPNHILLLKIFDYF
ncbi:MAG: hypothetical protein B6I24_11370 [Bacteroidetes bacterium 4572_128]|nr:MAG: hypothetical protein B6I24_11370 [Bacteroidetes bacterium 4572_128]